MNNLDPLLQRNKEFAAQQSAEGTLMPSLPRAMPNVKAIIIGCADMRVDPAHVLGIKPGEAVVLRNIGGRITPGLLEQLALLGRIGEVAGEIAGGGREFHLVVLSTPIVFAAGLVYLGQSASRPVYQAIALLPMPIAGPVRTGLDYLVGLTMPSRDGLTWIEVSDPRSRKADKLPSRVQ